MASYSTLSPIRTSGWSVSLRHSVKQLPLFCLILASLLLFGNLYRLTAVRPAVMASSAAKLALPTVAAAPVIAPPSALPPAPAKTVAPIVTASVQNCMPASGYTAPAKLDLAAAPDGLSVQTDPLQQYTLYGNTASQLRSQVQRCAPSASGVARAGAEFSAETGYSLVWQYNTVQGTASCSLTDIKVGLHLNMIQPQWQATSTAAYGLGSQWTGFIVALSTHEGGHAAIDRQYANQLLGNLQVLPADDCLRLATTIHSIIISNLAALNHANETYDTATQHGAAQGAVLPS